MCENTELAWAPPSAYNIVVAVGAGLSILNFDVTGGKLSAVGTVPSLGGGGNTWIEPGDNNMFYTQAENGAGLFSCMINDDGSAHTMDTIETCKQPVHIHKMVDAISVACYADGSVAYIPLKSDGTFDKDKAPKPLVLKGGDSKTHSTMRLIDGTMWAAALGDDAVYRWTYDGTQLAVDESFPVPAKFGPRHMAVIDYSNPYVLGETSNSIVYLTKGSTDQTSEPVSILPDDVGDAKMLAAELFSHPTRRATLYASNRGVKGGDTVSIFKIDPVGAPAKSLVQVKTGCEGIRGLKTTPDGRYVGVLGETNGLLEIYSVAGEKKEEWKLVTSIKIDGTPSDLAFFPKKK